MALTKKKCKILPKEVQFEIETKKTKITMRGQVKNVAKALAKCSKAQTKTPTRKSSNPKLVCFFLEKNSLFSRVSITLINIAFGLL